MRKLLLVVAVALGVTACQKDYYLDDLNEAERQIEKLQSINSDLTNRLNADKSTIADLQVDITVLNDELTDAQAVIDSTTNELGQVSIELATTQASLTLAIDEVDSLQIELTTISNELESALASDTMNLELIEELENAIQTLEIRLENAIETQRTVIEYVYIHTTTTVTAPAPEVEDEPAPEVEDEPVQLNQFNMALVDAGFTRDGVTYTSGEFTATEISTDFYDLTHSNGDSWYQINSEELLAIFNSYGTPVAWNGVVIESFTEQDSTGGETVYYLTAGTSFASPPFVQGATLIVNGHELSYVNAVGRVLIVQSPTAGLDLTGQVYYRN